MKKQKQVINYTTNRNTLICVFLYNFFMAIIYGSGFKPMKLATGDVKSKDERQKEATWDTALEISLNVLTAVSFIALSFIPIAGEVAAAAEVGEITSLTVESAAESIIAGNEIAEVASSTAKIVRLGHTVKGSLGLGLAEASVNTLQDYAFDHLSPVNEAINWGLAFTPIIGIKRAKKLARNRLIIRANVKIAKLKKLIENVSVDERIVLQQQIRELENITMINSAKGMYSHKISSVDYMSTKREILNFIETSAEGNLNVKVITNEVKRKLELQNLHFTKTEVRKITREVTNKMPNISEGLSVKGITSSKMYGGMLNALRWADPSLAMRKIMTGTSAFLTSDKNVLVRQVSRKTGKWEYKFLAKSTRTNKVIIGGEKINLGMYKKLGKKLSKFWRAWGKKIYKASSVRMIPVLSSWIDGYRILPTSVPGEVSIIVIFKPSKNGSIPEPRVIGPMGINRVFEFESGGVYESVGSFYINEFALARNGTRTTVSSLTSLLGFLPLGELRKALALPSAFERIFKKISYDDMFSHYFDYQEETFKRLLPHKIGKIAAGRWGIAAARGFQSVKKGHTVFDFGKSNFDWRYLIEEVGVVSLDKSRSVQRKAGIMGRTHVIGARRQKNQYSRIVKNATFGLVRYDGKKGFKKGKGIFNI